MPGTIYRDLRIDAGRDELCLLELPGHLWVRDGESCFWFSEGHFGEEGNYKIGRKVGQWKECSRFGECGTRTYEPVDPLEKQRGVQPHVPVSYSQDRYLFDFRSCWGTWITRQADGSFVELNVGGDFLRCNVTYIPSTQSDRPSGTGGYLCEIPFAVRVRAFESIDLRSELTRLGLPQFCRMDDLDNLAVMIAFWSNLKVPTSDQIRMVLTANMVDVEMRGGCVFKIDTAIGRLRREARSRQHGRLWFQNRGVRRRSMRFGSPEQVWIVRSALCFTLS